MLKNENATAGTFVFRQMSPFSLFHLLTIHSVCSDAIFIQTYESSSFSVFLSILCIFRFVPLFPICMCLCVCTYYFIIHSVVSSINAFLLFAYVQNLFFFFLHCDCESFTLYFRYVFFSSFIFAVCSVSIQWCCFCYLISTNELK